MLSIKSACLNRWVILGDRHLRRAIAEYIEHDHQERTHQGLGHRLIEGGPEPRGGKVARRERLGGILNHDCREAAGASTQYRNTARSATDRIADYSNGPRSRISKS